QLEIDGALRAFDDGAEQAVAGLLTFARRHLPAGKSSSHVNHGHLETVDGFRLLFSRLRRGAAVGLFELPDPAVNILLHAAPVAGAKKEDRAFGIITVAAGRRHEVSHQAHAVARPDFPA